MAGGAPGPSGLSSSLVLTARGVRPFTSWTTFEIHLHWQCFLCRLVYHSTNAQPSPAPGSTVETPFVNGQICIFPLKYLIYWCAGMTSSEWIASQQKSSSVASKSLGKFLTPRCRIFPPRVKYLSLQHHPLRTWYCIILIERLLESWSILLRILLC